MVDLTVGLRRDECQSFGYLCLLGWLWRLSDARLPSSGRYGRHATALTIAARELMFGGPPY